VVYREVVGAPLAGAVEGAIARLGFFASFGARMSMTIQPNPNSTRINKNRLPIDGRSRLL
jgi:hypothetical protein